jgi:hypothetical protein
MEFGFDFSPGRKVQVATMKFSCVVIHNNMSQYHPLGSLTALKYNCWLQSILTFYIRSISFHGKFFW